MEGCSHAPTFARFAAAPHDVDENLFFPAEQPDKAAMEKARGCRL
jgi:hypothetical protein